MIEAPEVLTIPISGMTCGHCVATVRSGARTRPGREVGRGGSVAKSGRGRRRIRGFRPLESRRGDPGRRLFGRPEALAPEPRHDPAPGDSPSAGRARRMEPGHRRDALRELRGPGRDGFGRRVGGRRGEGQSGDRAGRPPGRSFEGHRATNYRSRRQGRLHGAAGRVAPGRRGRFAPSRAARTGRLLETPADRGRCPDGPVGHPRLCPDALDSSASARSSTRRSAGRCSSWLAVLQAYLGGPYYRGAWGRLRQGSSNMDTLVALGTSTAFGYSLAPAGDRGMRTTPIRSWTPGSS